MRAPASIIGATIAVSLAGCGESAAPTPALCAGQNEIRYDPLAGSLAIYPDNVFTELDAISPTGLRLRLEPGVDAVIDPELSDFEPLFSQATGASGFGVSGDILIDTTGGIDTTTLPAIGAAPAQASILIFELFATGELEAVALEATTFASELEGEGDGTTLRLSPIHGLKPATTYGVAVTNRLRDPGGGCLAPSEAMRRVLLGTAADPRLAGAAANVAHLVTRLRRAGVIAGVQDLSAAVVFTTLDTAYRPLRVAAAIRERPAPAWQTLSPCEAHGDYRVCEGAFDWVDYRNAEDAPHANTVIGTPGGTLPVTVYLPSRADGPYPLVFFGHGISSSRAEARGIAAGWAARGWATIALDAPKHGDHPDQGSSSGIIAVLEMLGIGLDLDPIFSGITLRDSFLQAAYDKLGALRALAAHPDIDGDAIADLDTDTVAYYGISLGGIMGPPFVALSGEVDLTVLAVTGGELTTLVSDGPPAELVRLAFLSHARPADAARLFAVMQGIGDPGDPAAWGVSYYATHPGRATRSHHLHQIVVEDEVFGVPSCHALVQKLGLPIMGDLLTPIPGLDQVPLPQISAPDSPVRGAFLFDVVPDGDDVTAAQHFNTPGSAPAQEQVLHLVETFNRGAPEIVDPYRVLGLKP